MKIKAERGYLIPAIGSIYEDCAEQLKQSILQWHPSADITILTREQLPYGDLGGFVNDWQMFYCSPYRQTVKLEADMYCAGPIDHWWTLFQQRDIVISQGCRDIFDQYSHDRRYRRVFDRNHLPDVYNAITYWRLSRTAQEFFSLVRDIFENWSDYKTLLNQPDDIPSTDLVYAMASVIMGPETVTLPYGIGPSIVHMKKGIISGIGDDWTESMFWEADPTLRINTVSQWGLVHYHIKHWRAHEQ